MFVTGLCALGWWMLRPSSGHRNCWGLRLNTSSLLLGHWYFPRSSRLYKRIKPSESQYKALKRSALRPQQEQGVGKGIQLIPVLYNAHQPVNPAAQVCVSAGDVHMLDFRRVKHLASPSAAPGAEAPGHIRHSLPPSRQRCAAQEQAFELKLLRQVEPCRE